MKKMKRFLVALLSCLTAVACVAGISACKDDKKTATNDSSISSAPSTDINVNFGKSDCNHEYDVLKEVPATCEVAGVKYIGCTKCGQTVTAEGEYNVIEIPALGHTIKYVKGVEATCTEDGVVAHLECEVCGKVADPNMQMGWMTLAYDFVIPATGHDWENENASNTATLVDALAPTCVDAGHTGYAYCTTCMNVELAKEENIAKASLYAAEKGIDFLEAKKLVIADLLAADAIATSGKSVLEATNHADKVWFSRIATSFAGIGTFDKEGGKIAASNDDCTIKGIKDFKICASCPDFYAVNGKRANAVKAWNELKNAKPADIAKVLADAGIVADEVETIATTKLDAHDFGEAGIIPGKSATCTEAGYKASGLCVDCGYEYNMVDGKVEVLPALDHKTAVGAEATCDTGVNCDVCKQEVIAKLGHDMISVDDKAATCTAAGWEDRAYCSRCDYKESTAVPATGHDWEVVDIDYYTEDDMTCEQGSLTAEDEEKWFICADCDATGKNLGYKWNKTDSKLAEDHVIGEIKVEAIDWAKDPIKHDAKVGGTGEDKNDYICAPDYVAATCGADAEDYECKFCGESIIEESKILATGKHTTTGTDDNGTPDDKTDDIKAKTATCLEDGYCLVCGVLEAYDHKVKADDDDYSALEADSKYGTYKAATCTDAGNLECYVCTRCDDMFALVNGEYVTEIELAGEGNAIDLGEKGSPNKAIIEIAATGHNFERDDDNVLVLNNEGKLATCEEDGYSAYATCLSCGGIYAGQDKNGNDLTGKEISDATKYEFGMKLTLAEVKCANVNSAIWCVTVCDHSYIAEWNDVNGNGLFDDYVVSADSETGYYIDENENGEYDEGEEAEVVWAGCGEVITNKEADQHTYNTDHVCILCEKSLASKTHTYGEDHKCTICNAEYKVENVYVTAHNYESDKCTICKKEKPAA